MKKISKNLLEWQLKFLAAPPKWKKEILEKEKEKENKDDNKENIYPGKK